MMCPYCADSVMDELDEGVYYCEGCGETVHTRDDLDSDPEFPENEE